MFDWSDADDLDVEFTDDELAYLRRRRWARLLRTAASLGLAIAIAGVANGLMDAVPRWLSAMRPAQPTATVTVTAAPGTARTAGHSPTPTAHGRPTANRSATSTATQPPPTSHTADGDSPAVVWIAAISALGTLLGGAAAVAGVIIAARNRRPD